MCLLNSFRFRFRFRISATPRHAIDYFASQLVSASDSGYYCLIQLRVIGLHWIPHALFSSFLSRSHAKVSSFDRAEMFIHLDGRAGSS